MDIWFVMSIIGWVIGHGLIITFSYADVNNYKKHKGGSSIYYHTISRDKAKKAQRDLKIALFTIWLAPLAFVLIPVGIVGWAGWAVYEVIRSGFGSLDA